MDYKFDAFISYRHCDLDKFVAENLHKLLETYKPPKSALKKSTRKSIKRVFRDQEELPLTSNLEDPIIDALKQSEYLIVICSPRLKDSAWCRKEIETFISMHGRDKVLAVLIEGEPDESFPEEILKGEERTIYENGIPRIVCEKCEPLAADFRGANKNEVKKKMKKEVLRLMAPMFNVDFDDLRQRHKERRLHTIIRTSICISVIAFLFGAYCAYTAVKIKKQNIEIKEQADKISDQAYQIQIQSNKIEKQYNELKVSQANTLTRQSLDYFEDDERLDSIKYSIMALTEYNGVEMPYTPEAQFALTLSSRIYSGEYEIAPVADVKMPSIINDFKISSNGTRSIVVDKAGNVKVFSLLDLKQLYETTTNIEYELHLDYYGFINDDTIYYVTEEDKYQINIVDINTGKEKNTIKVDSDKYYSSFDKIAVSPDENKLVAAYEGHDDSLVVHIYDTGNFEEITNYSTSEYNSVEALTFLDENTILFSEADDLLFNLDAKETKFVVFDIAKNKELISFSNNISTVEDVCYMNDKIYIITSNYSKLLAINSCVYAYDFKTGNKLWSRNLDGISLERILASDDALLISMNRGVRVLDTDTGEDVLTCETSNEIIEISFLSDKFYLLEANGLRGIVNLDSGNFFEFSYINCTRLSKIKNIANGFIGIPENSQSINIYNNEINEQKAEFTGDYSDPSENNLIYSEEKDHFLEKIKVSNSSLVKYVYNYEELNICIVQYYDETQEVYDTKTNNLLGRFEISYTSLSKYFGRDIYGNYIFGDYNAIILNENFELIGNIPCLAGISEDKKYYIQYDYVDEQKKLYSVPVYSLDEIIKYGKDRLVEYNH